MLPVGQSGELPALLTLVPTPWNKTEPWISRQSLRPEEQIISMRERAEVWAWRLEVESDRRKLRNGELQRLEETILVVAREGHEAGYLSYTDDSAFSVDAVPVSTMRTEDIEELRLITISRLKALNWVCGFGDDWYSVPLDV